MVFGIKFLLLNAVLLSLTSCTEGQVESIEFAEYFPDTYITTQKPFRNIELPGSVNAFEYDYGGQGVSYYDITPDTGGLEVLNYRIRDSVDFGYYNSKKYVVIETGEWLEYTINVKQSSKYDISFEYSSEGNPGSIELFLDDVALVSGQLNTTNLNQFLISGLNGAKSSGVEISAGVHILKVKGGSNLNLRAISFETTEPEVESFPIYQLNVGEGANSEWLVDKDFINTKKNYEDGTGRNIASFGIGDGSLKVSSVVDHNQDLPEFVKTTYRTDKLDESSHTPGLNYRFLLAKGQYKIKLYSPVLESSYQYEVRDLSDKLLQTIQVNGSEVFSIKEFSIDVSLDSQQEFGITLYPVWPGRDLSISAIEIVSFEVQVGQGFIKKESLPTRYITPDGTGAKNGIDWSNAAPLSALNTMIDNLKNTGGEILLRADVGPYIRGSSLNLYTGSQSDNPIVVRGVNLDGSYGMAIIEGNRTFPWDESGEGGSELFRLNGTNNMVFRDIEFRNVGSIFRLTRDVQKLKLTDIKATNFNRFLNSYKSGSYSTASLIDSSLSFIEAKGYTKYTSIIKYNSSNISFNQIFTDSERQTLSTPEDFSNGLHFEDNSTGLKTSYVTSLNHHHDKQTYYNADSFSSERNVTNVEFYRTIAAGNTDGGFDVKSFEARFNETISIDNKRNYRIWDKAFMNNIVSIAPFHRGGSGDAHHLGRYGDTGTTIVRDSNFINQDNLNKVFYVEYNKTGQIDVDFTQIKVLKGTTLKGTDASRISFGSNVEITEN